MATIDDLTGLLTINAFQEQLEAAIREGNKLVLVYLDLDHFSSINEKYGHMKGDIWMKQVCQMFKEEFGGEGSIVGRSGGEEFVAVLRESDPTVVFHKAEALRQRVAQTKPAIQAEDIRPGFTVSMGLASFPINASNTNDLIDKGDQAMRRAKVAGRNQVCFYQEVDMLTGVLNRTAVLQALEEAVAHARQENDSLSVFVLDIDRFKQINDEYGHRAGDEVLKRLGHILQTNFAPAAGIPGRHGGDEFVVILPGQRADSAFILAEEVRRLIEDSELTLSLGAPGREENSFSLRFHISGGIAAYPGDGSEAVDLLRKAEEALYRSKQIGRNRISLPASAQMITKTSYYTQLQLESLSGLAHKLDKTEAFLLREALDDLLFKYKKDEFGHL
jgi:diguanylate cyclase